MDGRATAMRVEMAREQRAKLVANGVSEKGIRIRQRTWDNEGLYFALDVQENGQTVSLYTPVRVDDFLAARRPVDTVPFMVSTRMGSVNIYQFKDGHNFLKAPDGSFWWSMADIKKVGGIATHNGKRYRLGEKKFVPFVGE